MAGARREIETKVESLRHSVARLQPTRWFGIHLLAAIGVFALGMIVGAGLIQLVSLDALAEFAAEQSTEPPSDFGPLTVRFIAQNNLIALAVTLGGALTFGLFSAVSMFFNGLSIGAFLAIFAESFSPVLIAAWLLPHGIFELPALWLAGAIGLRVPHRLIRYLRGKDEQILSRTEVVEVVILVAILVLLIIIAAWIEVTVTPEVAERVAVVGYI